MGQYFPLGGLRIQAFHTSHDTQESVGYRIEGSAVFALATDTGCVTEEILEGLTGSDAVLIESNHDTQMLCDGPYPVYLKRRILSDNGHLSNCDCAVLAKRLADTGTQTVILGHLSRNNNLPSLALEASEKALSGSPVELFCAPELGILEIDI